MTPEETKAIKLAWANGEVVQGCDSESGLWTDWSNNGAINLDYWHYWRVKPKPITVYVWASVGESDSIIGSHSRKTYAEAAESRFADMRLGIKCTPIVEVKLERPE